MTTPKTSVPRFSKQALLGALDNRADNIGQREKFNRSHGTRQLNPSGEHDELVRRAFEYGRMRAFEQVAEMVEENLRFEVRASAEPSPQQADGGKHG